MNVSGATLVRLLLGALGLAGMGVGALLLLERPDALPHVAAWYVVPVALHDGLLAPLGLALAWLGVRLLPARLRGPALGGLLATAGLTLLVLPNLLRPEPRPVTLLDRNYVAGYVGALALVWATVLVVTAVRARTRGRRDRRDHDQP